DREPVDIPIGFWEKVIQLPKRIPGGVWKRLYVCAWCALKVEFDSFITRRVGNELTEKKELLDRHGIIKLGESRFEPVEQISYIGSFPWYYHRAEIRTRREEWKDYIYDLTGIILKKIEAGESAEQALKSIRKFPYRMPPYAVIIRPNDQKDKLVLLLRTR